MAIVLDRTFEVDAAPEAAWDFLTDPDRVFPCIPTGRVVERLDERTFLGKLGFTLGPFGAEFRGEMELDRVEPDRRRVRLTGEAEDTRRDVRATLEMTSSVSEGDGGGARVEVIQRIGLAGSLAGMAEGGLARNTADMLFGRFVACVRGKLDGR